MTNNVQEIILKAKAKALGTTNVNGLTNVVPVSIVRIEDGDILLFNFFMDKTLKNLQTNPQVALTCWSGLSGIQIKGQVEYVTEGEWFESQATWVTSINPDRVAVGVLKITPEKLYDIGPITSLDTADFILDQ